MLPKSSCLICALQLCCMLLVLASAQHAALTHSVWHAAGTGERASTHAHGDHDHDHDHENDAHGELCAFHLALGQVLGVVCGAAALAACAACASHVYARAQHARIAPEAIHPVSRGPPILL